MASSEKPFLKCINFSDWSIYLNICMYSSFLKRKFEKPHLISIIFQTENGSNFETLFPNFKQIKAHILQYYDIFPSLSFHRVWYGPY